MNRLGRTAFTAVRVAAAGLALGRIGQGAFRRPPLRPVRPGLPIGTTVTVVVPARDEERRLGPCLEALSSDPQVAEVVVVDDESSDGTAALAAALGARVVPGTSPPPGWVGKPWALQQGLAGLHGEWVLALDADTRPLPGLVAALVAEARERDLDLLSGAGRFVCDGPLLSLLHPAMLATLVYRFPPPGSRRQGRPGRRIANGQCLLLRRDTLVAEGGFTLAAAHMTDDVALVRGLARRGHRTALCDVSALLEVRMHRDAADAWRSWGRSLPLADVTSPAWLAADIAVLWLAQALPGVRVAMRRADRLDAVLVAVRLGLVAALARAYRPPRRLLWLSPLADVPVAARLTWGALRPGRSWRGRTYPRPATPLRSAAR